MKRRANLSFLALSKKFDFSDFVFVGIALKAKVDVVLKRMYLCYENKTTDTLGCEHVHVLF